MKFSIKDFFSKCDLIHMHCVKSGRTRNFSGPSFSSFGLNTKIYRVNLCSQSECVKMRTRKTPNMDTFHAVWSHLLKKFLIEVFTSLFSVLLVFEKNTGKKANIIMTNILEVLLQFGCCCLQVFYEKYVLENSFFWIISTCKNVCDSSCSIKENLM